MSLADVGIDPAMVGLQGSATEIMDWGVRPPREPGVLVKDDGDGGRALAAFLAGRKFI